MKTAKLLTIFFVLVALMLTARAALGADTDIVINEIMVNPSTGDQWVELYNPGSSSVNYNVLGNGFIRTENGDTPITGKILAGDYLIVELDFPATETGDRFVLKNQPSGFIDALTFGDYTNDNIPEHIDDNPGEDEVIARIHDGLDEWIVSDEATEGTANNRLPEGEVPIQELVETVQKNVDLSQHFEDIDGDDLVYKLVSEENASCTITDEELKIIATGKDSGYCQIKVKDDIGFIKKYVEFSVTPALEITEVVINDESVTEGEETTEMMPSEPVSAYVKIKNNLGYTVFNVDAELSVLSSPPMGFDGDSINIGGGSTGTIYFEGTIPQDVDFGIYDSDLIVTGTSLYLESVGDGFSFNTIIYQEVSELTITDLTLNHDELICKDKTTLKVSLMNTGINDANNAVATVKVGGEEYSKVFTVASGNTVVINFAIFAEDLSQGNNQILVEVPYGNGQKDSDYISIAKEQCILSWLPEEDAFIMSLDTDEMSVEISEETYNDDVEWYVDNVLTGTGNEFDFTPNIVGDYEVYATIAGEFTQTWDYYVTDVPLSASGLFPEDYFEGKNTAHIVDFTLENSYGKIVFDEVVDVSGILDMDEVINIASGLVGIDTGMDAAPELDAAATVTIKKSFTNYLILKAEGFGDNVGEFVLCGNDCEFVSNNNGQFVFTVTGFSTYKVVEQLPADILITGIEINDINRGESVNKEITFTNTGSYDSLTGIVVNLENVDADYNPVLSGNNPTTLAPGEAFTLTLTLSVPEDADGGDNVIGKISFVSNELIKEDDVVVSPMSYLSIESIKINGKSSGDLSIEETNEIEVEVKNKYTEDMTDVQVTVEILDVDGDDLEEDSDEQDINEGKDEDFVVEFDLDSSEMDEESYTIRITVTGEADDDTQHETVETKVVDLSREKHKIVIDKTSLSSNTLQCLRQTTLQVTVENIGEESEDDVEVWIKNDDLGLSLSRTNIDLEDYSDNDNDYKATFTLSLEDAVEGSYPITVEVYRDGDLEETEEITVEVKDCYTSSTTAQSTSTYVDENALAMQLQQQLAAKKNLDVQKISSFRDTNTYTTLLVTLVVLMLIVVVLALAVSAKKPKRRR